MRTYVIANLKGGVGKTTSAVNIAYSMALSGKRVLVVDADPQANLTPFFTRSNTIGMTVKNALQHPDNIRKIIRRSKYLNIDVIKGDTRLRECDAENPFALQQGLSEVEDRYDICIIDTRPAFEALTKSALYAADILLTPVLLDKFCRDNLLLVEDKLDELDPSGPITPQWKIFVNKVINKKTQREIYRDMVQMHQWVFLDTCVSRSADIENALSLYKPVMKHRSKSPVAADYMELAKELLEA